MFLTSRRKVERRRELKALWKLRYLRSCTGGIQSHGEAERKDLRVISRMQLVNGHEGDGGGGVRVREVDGKAMVLDPVILPLPHFCFVPPRGREVGNLKRLVERGGGGREELGGNYDFAYKHVEVVTRFRAAKD